MSRAGWQQRVDVAGGARAGDRPQRDSVEGIGEQLGRESYREAAEDESADRELVVHDRDEVWGEAGGAARADDQAVAQGGRPVVVSEIGDADRGAVGEPVTGRQRDHESLA